MSLTVEFIVTGCLHEYILYKLLVREGRTQVNLYPNSSPTIIVSCEKSPSFYFNTSEIKK